MLASDAAGLTWSEEAVTEVYLAAAHPTIRAAVFTRWEEARLGSDWIWWWVDGTGACFGMLVQAKRIHKLGERPVFDFGHTNTHGLQRDLLRRAAGDLGVAAMYALYTGTPASRNGLCCSATHYEPTCTTCEPATVSVTSELLVRTYSSTRVPAEDVLAQALPVEHAVIDHEAPTANRWIVGALGLDDDLRQFLLTPQTGAKRVARSIFDRVLATRMGQFSLAAPAHSDRVTDARIFEQLPRDAGHFGEPYFESVLRGLRSAPPAYATALAAGEQLILPPAASWLDDEEEGPRGVVVISLGGEGSPEISSTQLAT